LANKSAANERRLTR